MKDLKDSINIFDNNTDSIFPQKKHNNNNNILLILECPKSVHSIQEFNFPLRLEEICLQKLVPGTINSHKVSTVKDTLVMW